MKLAIFPCLGLAVLLASCATAPPPVQQASVAQAAPRGYDCRKFSTPVAIDGATTQQLSGYACRQADGTWKPVDSPPPSYAYDALYGGPIPPAPDALIAPNCDYPMALTATEQCNWYLNRHKFGHH